MNRHITFKTLEGRYETFEFTEHIVVFSPPWDKLENKTGLPRNGMYRLSDRRWILRSINKDDRNNDTYREVSLAGVARWFSVNGMQHPIILGEDEDEFDRNTGNLFEPLNLTTRTRVSSTSRPWQGRPSILFEAINSNLEQLYHDEIDEQYVAEEQLEASRYKTCLFKGRQAIWVQQLRGAYPSKSLSNKG